MSEEGSPSVFVGAENYRGGQTQTITFDVVVMQHVQAVLRSSLADWSGGFFGQKPHVTSSGVATIEVWVESSADVYTHAVLSLYDLLSGYVDGDVDKAYASLQDEEKVLRASFGDVVNAQGNVDKYRVMSFKYARAHAHRRLFRSLMFFLKKEQYLGSSSSEEGMTE